MRTIETQVAVIGGGATGAGVFRDCALRGIPCVLVEKDDLAAGASGRNHGLLHSGGRYAVKDTMSAMECILENRILRRIAGHCVEDTGGLFVTLPEDDPEYHRLFLAACEAAHIPAREISVKRALAIEPNLNPAIVAAAHVPDGTVDPFRLTAANVIDGVARGGMALTHTEATAVHSENGRITGISCRNKKSGDAIEITCRVVVNAAGVFGQRICKMAGVSVSMLPSKGSMVIIDYRVNNVVINRCRKPSDGDIIVPGDTVSLIGTTSRTIAYEDIEKLTVDDDEINVLLEDGEKLIPNVSRTRVLRAYAGVRPLVAPDKGKEGRDVSRGIVLLDHGERDGLFGLVTIAGGKLTTYRLMAEETCDLVCRLLDVQAACETHLTPLP
ncbi:MAG: anaerobic glycerol-3-phosphate dehydrogenase subunit A, partial [Thermodesulfobacteriota bacterium]